MICFRLVVSTMMLVIFLSFLLLVDGKFIFGVGGALMAIRSCGRYQSKDNNTHGQYNLIGSFLPITRFWSRMLKVLGIESTCRHRMLFKGSR